jgi:succinate dehydrogenase/fumarate reductase flavoprotein subunit
MEVAPACHHMMGGIIINRECQTRVPGLFAAGEVTSGIHGSNRIAGAAGTDVLVFGRRAGVFSAQFADSVSEPSDSDFNRAIQIFRDKWEPKIGTSNAENNFQSIWNQVRNIMWDKVSIVRNEKNLSEALEELKAIGDRMEQIKVNSDRDSLRNYFRIKSASFVSRIIAQAALIRKESRGDHCRDDFPERDDLNWLKHIVIAQDSRGQIEMRYKNLEPPNTEIWNFQNGSDVI